MCDEKMKSASKLRPLWLTLVLFAIVCLGAADLAYGTFIIGVVLLIAASGLYAVIVSVCVPSLSVFDGIGFLALVFFTSGMDEKLMLLGGAGLIIAILLSILSKKKSAKTTTVISMTGVLLLWLVLSVMIMRLIAGASVSPDVIITEIIGYFDNLAKEWSSSVGAVIESMSDSLHTYYEAFGTNETELKAMYASMITVLLKRFQLMLPGIVLAAGQAVSYLTVVFFTLTVRVSRCEALLPEPKWILYPTQITCVMYMIATFAYVVTSFFSSTAEIVALNILLVLWPSMGACGCRGIITRLRHPLLKRGTIITLIIFGIGFVFLPSVAFSIGGIVLAFIGAKDVSAIRMAEKDSNRFRKQ